MSELDAAQWDACANPQPGEDSIVVDESPAADATTDACQSEDALKERFNPFIRHAFLKALETSGSVGPKTGWTVTHVIVEDDKGKIVAAAPSYLKTHSMGEYVFDYGWADAYHRGGLKYYPKLQVCVPFTPATGRRLLVLPEAGEPAQHALILGLRTWREKIGASSIHVTFPTKAEWDAMGKEGFLQRTGQQFHFINKGYADFDGFLADLASRKRKMIKRERKDALQNDITIELLTGKDLKEEHWDAFYFFYTDTGSRKWGKPYLTREFFSHIGESMSEDILLVMAKRNGRYIAGAINFIGKDALYGRNWGCLEEHPFLHFEVCYYQAIEYAITHGLSRVEAGAQGEHKLARGYGPAITYSAHEIADPRYAHAIDEFLQKERAYIDEANEEYAEHVPFKKGG
ncbi:GNAT family N-acetyltransferase [Methyloferula stellata]|uniref:GNAT family N-acetyltransferase n=1 Tax=Methyloferula stellata TaxID=876270 RepID=UPI000367F8CF|nr:GNAT family N-acetyltransferase [Methyloferula stellata]